MVHGAFVMNILIAQSTQDSIMNTRIDTLRQMFDKLYSVQTDSEKDQLNLAIMDFFTGILESPASIDVSLDTLDKIGKLVSDDERILVVTWNIPYIDGMHAYFGLLQYRDKNKEVLKVQKLQYTGFPREIPETKTLEPENWYGALYYSIVTTEYRKEVFYTLLGYDFHTPLTNRKIIDVIKVNDNLQFKFGYPVFLVNGKVRNRMVFKYAQDIVMNVKFNENMDMIVYDHLVPLRPSLQGEFEFYGPDGTFDGLKFDDGKWKHYPDVDLRKTNAL